MGWRGGLNNSCSAFAKKLPENKSTLPLTEFRLYALIHARAEILDYEFKQRVSADGL
jgi:hypothetical protein